MYISGHCDTVIPSCFIKDWCTSLQNFIFIVIILKLCHDLSAEVIETGNRSKSINLSMTNTYHISRVGK